jgi:hypothetical protein
MSVHYRLLNAAAFAPLINFVGGKIVKICCEFREVCVLRKELQLSSFYLWLSGSRIVGLAGPGGGRELFPFACLLCSFFLELVDTFRELLDRLE